MIRRSRRLEKAGEEWGVVIFGGRVDERDDFVVAMAGGQFASGAAKVVGQVGIGAGGYQQADYFGVAFLGGVD